MISNGFDTTASDRALEIRDVRVIDRWRGADLNRLVSAEVLVIAALPLRGTDSDANVGMRGVFPRVTAVRDNVRVIRGRFFQPGLYEIVVGKHAARAYAGLDLDATVRIGPGHWKVVGIFDANGSAFDSEIWADADVLNGNYQRPAGVFQSVTARLRSSDDFPAFEAAVERDPRLKVQAIREPAYYEGSHRLSQP